MALKLVKFNSIYWFIHTICLCFQVFFIEITFGDKLINKMYPQFLTIQLLIWNNLFKSCKFAANVAEEFQCTFKLKVVIICCTQERLWESSVENVTVSVFIRIYSWIPNIFPGKQSQIRKQIAKTYRRTTSSYVKNRRKGLWKRVNKFAEQTGLITFFATKTRTKWGKSASSAQNNCQITTLTVLKWTISNRKIKLGL